METIPIANCENIGYIKKTHGVHGELVIEYETAFENSLDATNRFFLKIEGLLVPFFLVENGLRFRTAKTAAVKLDGVSSEKYAKRLVGCAVYLFKNEIIDEIDEAFTVEQLPGYLLIDTNVGELGVISQVEDFSGNVVLSVHFQNDEKLIPFNEDFLLELNHERKTLTLTLPEGIIEL